MGMTEEQTRAKIKEIEDEMARTQKNKATNGHLGLLKARIAKLKSELVTAATAGGLAVVCSFSVLPHSTCDRWPLRMITPQFLTLRRMRPYLFLSSSSSSSSSYRICSAAWEASFSTCTYTV